MFRRSAARPQRKSSLAVDESLLGGWQVAWRELKERGIDPHRDFSQLLFGGTHDAVVYGVRDGKVDPGTVRADTLERTALEGEIRREEFQVVCEHDREATANGGTLKICLSTEGGKVLAKVADTGHGVEKERLDQIFEPSSGTKRVGAGLGLNVSSGTVQG